MTKSIKKRVKARASGVNSNIGLTPEVITIFARGVFMLYINNFSKEYSKGKKAVDNISLTVNAGEIFGFIGHNGAGKTTTIKSIVGILEFSEGDILIDNKSIYDLTLESLRSNIGIVQQEVFLFTGTIKENIKYGKQDATDDEIIEAAKRANIHNFIIRTWINIKRL